MIAFEAGVAKITDRAAGLQESKDIIKDKRGQDILQYVYYVYSPNSVYANVLFSRRKSEVYAKIFKEGTYEDLEKEPHVRAFIDSYVSKSIPYQQQFYEAWKREVDDFLVKIHQMSFLDADNNLDFKKKAEALKYADQLLSLGIKYEKSVNAEKKKSGFTTMIDDGGF